jgi:hypothetical protein
VVVDWLPIETIPGGRSVSQQQRLCLHVSHKQHAC